jgi:putative SOS response-associated peptidase YedK
MQAHDTNVFDESYFAPSYNVAPQSWQPVVRLNEDTGERELTIMRWGLVPYWSKDGKCGFSTINARAETITTNATYRGPMQRRRCLVPADWFYEWKKLDGKNRQPYAIAMKNKEPFAFAGLWDRWKDSATGQTLETYTIITTDPNAVTESLHDRMPVILRPRDYQRWLDPADPRSPPANLPPANLPIDVLRPFDPEEMTAWQVGAAVGNVRNNSPELAEPI